jgi:predicted dehydrogenase
MLFGAEPIRVQGTVTRDSVTGVDTLTSGILDFDDGIASFTCSTHAEPDQRVHIYGTEGRISLEIPFNIPWDRPTRVLVTAGGDPPVRPETEVLTFDPANEYSIQAERFAAAALDGGPVPIPPSDAVGNLRVIEELFRAG